MPFEKVGENDYTGPTGKHFNGAQVRLYYARGGHFAQGGEVPMIKGQVPQDASYAQGGPVLGRTRDFLKEGDVFVGRDMKPEKADFETPQEYADNKQTLDRRTFKGNPKDTEIKTKHPGPNVVKGFGSKGNRGY